MVGILVSARMPGSFESAVQPRSNDPGFIGQLPDWDEEILGILSFDLLGLATSRQTHMPLAMQ